MGGDKSSSFQDTRVRGSDEFTLGHRGSMTQDREGRSILGFLKILLPWTRHMQGKIGRKDRRQVLRRLVGRKMEPITKRTAEIDLNKRALSNSSGQRIIEGKAEPEENSFYPPVNTRGRYQGH